MWHHPAPSGTIRHYPALSGTRSHPALSGTIRYPESSGVVCQHLASFDYVRTDGQGVCLPLDGTVRKTLLLEPPLSGESEDSSISSVSSDPDSLDSDFICSSDSLDSKESSDSGSDMEPELPGGILVDFAHWLHAQGVHSGTAQELFAQLVEFESMWKIKVPTASNPIDLGRKLATCPLFVRSRYKSRRFWTIHISHKP